MGVVSKDLMWYVLTSQNNSSSPHPSLTALTQLNAIRPQACPNFSLCREGFSFFSKTWLVWDGGSDGQGETAKVQHQFRFRQGELRQPGTYIKIKTQHLPWVSVNAPQQKVARTQKPHSAQAGFRPMLYNFPHGSETHAAAIEPLQFNPTSNKEMVNLQILLPAGYSRSIVPLCHGSSETISPRAS